MTPAEKFSAPPRRTAPSRGQTPETHTHTSQTSPLQRKHTSGRPQHFAHTGPADDAAAGAMCLRAPGFGAQLMGNRECGPA